jgi:hypothetical protein
MNFLPAVLRRPFTVVILVIAVALAAGVATQRMSRDILPPRVMATNSVAQLHGGRNPALMGGREASVSAERENLQAEDKPVQLWRDHLSTVAGRPLAQSARRFATGR